MEIVMATSDKSLSQKNIDDKKGLLRKIAPKIYTTNLEDEPDVIIRRNVFYIIGQLYPQAVISHRSAYELKPTADGDIYLTYSYSKNISLPGLTVHLMEGQKEQDMICHSLRIVYIKFRKTYFGKSSKGR